MHRLEPGVEAALLGRLDHRLAGAHAVAFGDEVGERRIVLGELLRQRMVRRRWRRNEAPNSVSGRVVKTSSVLVAARRCANEDARAFGAADPVLLHQPHALGPALERLQRVEQLVGIMR